MRTLRRKKTSWENEEAALKDVMAAESLKKGALEGRHTETHYVWVTDAPKINFQPSPDEKPAAIFKVKKSEVENENHAARQAMEHFDTNEGNLRPEHTDSHFQYSKIKG